MIYVILALHFLLHMRLKFKKNSFADATASSPIARRSTSSEIAQFEGNDGNH
jgi:hypothetical protein